MVVSVCPGLPVPAGYVGYGRLLAAPHERRRVHISGGYPEFLRSSLLLDDMPKLAVGHRGHDGGNAAVPNLLRIADGRAAH